MERILNAAQSYRNAAPVRDAGAIRRFEQIDRRFLALALEHGAEEMQFSGLVCKSLLQRAEYPNAFPHLLMIACGCTDPVLAMPELYEAPNLSPQEWFLSPAVCYHVYGHFAGRSLNRTTLITSRGRCWRKEELFIEGRRQIEFEMREIVLLGSSGEIEEAIGQLLPKVDEIAARLQISGEWKVAEDPFFLPTAKGKALMQRVMETKREFVAGGDGPLAIASINRHGTFFGERFDISLPGGAPIHTACLAFGLDRWDNLTRLQTGIS